MLSTHAYAESTEPAELFVGGVFDQRGRVTAEQLARSAEASKPVRPAAFFKEPEVDETGAASQMLFIFDASETVGNVIAQAVRTVVCRTATQCERAFLTLVNAQSDIALLAQLGRPTGARFLAEDYRLTDDERAELKAEDAGLALQKTIILRYPTVKDARSALKQIALHREFSQAALDQTMSYSAGWDWPQSSPNDPYLAPQSNPQTYQWGMHKMNFPTAWYFTPGNAYLGVADGGVPLASETPQYFGNCWTGYNYVYSFHCDLAENFRPQFSLAPGGFFETRAIHGTHVTGIMAARGDNGQGVTGGCPWCSVAMARMNGPNAGGGGALASNAAAALMGLTDRGMQAINISANAFDSIQSPIGWYISLRCFEERAANYFYFCYSIAYANSRDVNLVASAGNYRWANRLDNIRVPVATLPATSPLVLAVGGIQSDSSMWSYRGLESPLPPFETPRTPWYEESSSAFAGQYGVVAPAVNVISTMPWPGAAYSPNVAYVNCGDSPDADLSGIYYDKYGTCTGTSMAAPHVTALVGLIRSVNPLLNRSEVETIITNSGDSVQTEDGPNPDLATAERGSGVPDAGLAVIRAINTNPSRLTPLFSFYSAARKDYFYTVVPQMAGAAIRGTLRPVNDDYVGSASAYSAVGTGLWAVQNFPNLCCGYGTPRAQAWVFTTPTEPNSGQLLRPLFRLSWKCGDGGQWPLICNSVPAHTDSTYTADPAGIAAFTSVGYSLDGVEGYIYPKWTRRPYGTVRLLRKYNAANDDHAIFPEVASIVSDMTNQGYTQNSGSDWLGWVYPNDGTRPVVY